MDNGRSWKILEDPGLAPGEEEECPLAESLRGRVSRSSDELDLPVGEGHPSDPWRGGGVVPAGR